MRAALYVDCGSVDVGDVPVICEEICRTDELVFGRMYGEYETEKSLIERTRRFCLQNSSLAGKDGCSALVALAVDVMADSVAGEIQRIYIATGNSTLIPLLNKLKLTQADVIVIGPCASDRDLVESSQRYMYIEVIRGGMCTAEIPSVNEVAGQIYTVSSYYNSMGANADLEQVYRSLVRRYPDFDVRNYGYAHLSTFVKKNVMGVEIENDDQGGMYIKVIDDRKRIDEFAYEYVADRGYEIEDMAELLDALREKFPGFAMENYGYHTDYGFILSFSRFQIWENKGIKMKRTFKLSSKSEESCSKSEESCSKSEESCSKN